MSELLESRWQDTKSALLEGLQGTKKSVMAATLENTRKYLSETAKLIKVVAAKDKQLAEAKAFAVKAKNLAEAKDTEVKRMAQIAERKQKIESLIDPLNKGQRDIMTDLLESVQTDRLQSAFDKYLPAVIDGKTPAKQKAVITEGTEVTGNREKTNVSSKADDNVVDIRRLAGLN